MNQPLLDSGQNLGFSNDTLVIERHFLQSAKHVAFYRLQSMLHLRLLTCSINKVVSTWLPRFVGFVRVSDLLQAMQLVKGNTRITGQAVQLRSWVTFNHSHQAA